MSRQHAVADGVWAAFIASSATAFLTVEVAGYKGGRHGTLTAALRRWLGIDPASKRKWIGRGAFGAALTAFAIHILVD